MHAFKTMSIAISAVIAQQPPAPPLSLVDASISILCPLTQRKRSLWMCLGSSCLREWLSVKRAGWHAASRAGWWTASRRRGSSMTPLSQTLHSQVGQLWSSQCLLVSKHLPNWPGLLITRCAARHCTKSRNIISNSCGVCTVLNVTRCVWLRWDQQVELDMKDNVLKYYFGKSERSPFE